MIGTCIYYAYNCKSLETMNCMTHLLYVSALSTYHRPSMHGTSNQDQGVSWVDVSLQEFNIAQFLNAESLNSCK